MRFANGLVYIIKFSFYKVRAITAVTFCGSGNTFWL